ncbi:MAG: cupin domain-containing protein [Thermoleophilia bacterium]|jgi:uncharacterized cupin superfamily protein
MAEHNPKIRVIKPTDVIWEDAPRYAEETDPAGDEYTALESDDERFSTGLWQRDVQRRSFERQYHEIAFIIEGEVEITDDEGNLITAGPGNILIIPKGSQGFWKNLSPVKKFWAIYDEPSNTLNSYVGPGPF